MPYKKTKVKIPLCKVCASAYSTTKDAEIVVVDSAKECLAHYVDLNTVKCMKSKPIKIVEKCNHERIAEEREPKSNKPLCTGRND